MDRKPLSKRSELVRDVDGLYVISTQHFPGLLEANAQKRNHGTAPKNWRHVAEIPNNLMAELIRKLGRPTRENQRAWKAWFNDSDNAAFRTWHGRV